MIELLKEERIAVINQAVTKGLNPKVEMKDFCIEWLGKVPKHWEVKKLKYVSDKVQTGITPPSERTDYYDGGNIDWYTPGDF
ncbi:MAG: restriction endonuclease subunit S, partial [Proteobacteria bacterium]|nr:restriction endonuclease subunit S [Pseudomonadota bacterium]